jgi:glycosyltransferase involved in cell wall biosynthesis
VQDFISSREFIKLHIALNKIVLKEEGPAESSISVIVPVYNGKPFLFECLESIMTQSLRPYEVIVVDDGSIDDSKNIVERFTDIKYLRIENSGVASARNTGISFSTGQWIAFIDQDDFWAKNSLRDRMNSATENTHDGIVIGKQQWFLDGLTTLPSWVKQEQMADSLDGFLLGCALIRRDLFETFGMFDSTFRLCSDFDWFFRLKDGDVIFRSVDNVVLHKRIHGENESRHADLSLKELSRALFASIKRKRKQSLTKKQQ